jgi:hypothetical protein
VAVNFLHANNENYSVTTTIIVSRKFVSMGRKSCLFVCYDKQIGTEPWIVEGVATLNGGLHNRTMEGKIIRRIWEQCRQVLFFFFFSSVSGDNRLD